MGWAMALKDAFDRFDKDFGAKRETLLMNYRSSPELVAIQEYLIRALDPNCAIPKSAKASSGISDHCRIYVFPDYEVEARYIASRVARALKQDGITPRDVCILVKQKAAVYSNAILAALEAAGIRARNESELQDLLAEPITKILVAFLKVAVSERAPAEWAVATETLALARRVDIESVEMRKVETEVISIAKALNQKLLAAAPSEERLHDTLRAAVTAIGESNLKAIYQQYRRGTFFRKLISQLAAALWQSYETRKDWKGALEDLTGKDVLPVMTIHKSKGLEYHTVIFLGLEDSAFWSFKQQSDEDTCAFFVAFSRAKERVIFTFSRQRTTRETHPNESQSNVAIRPLYDLLKSAGVKAYAINQWPPASQ
jgi:superfamily I DNA/RNA helicase